MNDKQCSREMIVELVELRNSGWNSVEIAREALSHPTTVRRYIRLYDLYGPEFFNSQLEMTKTKLAFKEKLELSEKEE